MGFKFNYLIFIIVFLAFYPPGTHQQGRYSRNNKGIPEEKKDKDSSSDSTAERTHWKAVAIVVMGVMILAAICYGTNCFWVCQFAFCDNPYTKMDRMAHV